MGARHFILLALAVVGTSAALHAANTPPGNCAADGKSHRDFVAAHGGGIVALRAPKRVQDTADSAASLRGKTRQQVVERMGKPSYVEPHDKPEAAMCEWVYVLNGCTVAATDFTPGLTLSLFFSPQGKVAKAIKNEWYLDGVPIKSPCSEAGNPKRKSKKPEAKSQEL